MGGLKKKTCCGVGWKESIVATNFNFFGWNFGLSLVGCGSIANSTKSQFSILCSPNWSKPLLCQCDRTSVRYFNQCGKLKSSI